MCRWRACPMCQRKARCSWWYRMQARSTLSLGPCPFLLRPCSISRARVQALVWHVQKWPWLQKTFTNVYSVKVSILPRSFWDSCTNLLSFSMSIGHLPSWHFFCQPKGLTQCSVYIYICKCIYVCMCICHWDAMVWSWALSSIRDWKEQSRLELLFLFCWPCPCPYPCLFLCFFSVACSFLWLVVFFVLRLPWPWPCVFVSLAQTNNKALESGGGEIWSTCLDGCWCEFNVASFQLWHFRKLCKRKGARVRVKVKGEHEVLRERALIDCATSCHGAACRLASKSPKSLVKGDRFKFLKLKIYLARCSW